MGGSVTKPISSTTTETLPPKTSPTIQPSITPPITISSTSKQTIKDVTLRPIVLGIPNDITMVQSPDGIKVSSNRVSESGFNRYVHVLKIMAQFARIVYCDLGTIHDVINDVNFGTDNNSGVNTAITVADKARAGERRIPAVGAQNGRPMKSYTTPVASDTSSPSRLTYVSSPSDLTFIIMRGSELKPKLDFFEDSDVIVCFKGSSTMKNFKHDLYSQFTPNEFSTLMPSGVVATSSAPIGNVTGAFVRPLAKSWSQLTEYINQIPPSRLFITGHSLGGAYASMFAFLVAETRASQFPSVKSAHLITFGAPTLLSDTARNSFNAHLESGFMTLDRVVSEGKVGQPDIIPTIPVGFSHPGYQPLRTEFKPEKNTGRAYQLSNIRKVYQSGGLLGVLSKQKDIYDKATREHMPTKLTVKVSDIRSESFPHAEYLDMTFFGAFRLYGMKNPGYRGNTFVGNIYPSGIAWKYVTADPTDVPAPDADISDKTMTDAGLPPTPTPTATPTGAPSEVQGGRRKTHKRQQKDNHRRSHRRRVHPHSHKH